jgi:hypothetical protein
MAAAWAIAGPLVTADAPCAPRVLDCTLGIAAGVIYENPDDPFAAPGVQCSANSSAPMLVLTGSRCRLIQADNEYNCSWSNVKQARATTALAAHFFHVANIRVVFHFIRARRRLSALAVL